ncbi:MAG: 3-deoxy-D-manno-octulosonate 8-phosphate phosphatase [Dehalococcoidia bacterium]|nr:3-deoxy-D-manno-octulosonate 8-phosphate phosphatase [Dehalococcoidia bacterium]
MDKYSKIIKELHKETKYLFKNVRLIAFDFDGVFTDNFVYTDENGRETVKSSRLDGIGLNKLKNLNVNSIVLSSEINNVVLERSKKLGIECKNGLKNKSKELIQIARSLDVDLTQTSFMGNDINDIGCLKMVGLPIVVPDSHNDVFEYSKYVTTAKGGHGAVREVCDIIERLKQ